MNSLKFRRQFLLCPNGIDQLNSWQRKVLNHQNLYVHPDCSLHTAIKGEVTVVVLGHIIHPGNKSFNEQHIAEIIAENSSIEFITKTLYPLCGRFVLLVATPEEILFFNDACGLKSFFYTQQNEAFYAASQPLLLKLAVGEEVINKGERYQSYFNSEYVKGSKEHWFPSGTSLYSGVYHLVPNHYLSTKTLQQVRYWPTTDWTPFDYQEGKTKVASLLKKTLESGAKKYKLGLGLTSGYDSRILLSASKGVSDLMQYYTFQYRAMDEKSNDIKIPKQIASKIGVAYSLYDCRVPTPEDFEKLYLENSDMAHLEDWGHIAYGISQNVQANIMSVKGSCSETGRCFFYKNGKHPKLKSYQDIVDINPKWNAIPFIKAQLKKWYQEVAQTKNNKGFPILDLFHWEVSTGSWQSQSQLEWDLVYDTFTPFNNRELLEIMLRIDTKYRSKPDYPLYRDVMQQLWPEVLTEPINPATTKRKVIDFTKRILVRLGKEKYNK
ncbi:hypothetical protein [Croceivirga sp. JEA036]|uniref:hypothetical protein n=1 Tax=Croceivirga sp. JEA036 TaxID=2721162 RepID=UPI00143A60E9|nr:hypothetical protein [Croceivirga sp. JEA036]NJB35396.1 hypothetical protein [Croceivirga sp. JEA036]